LEFYENSKAGKQKKIRRVLKEADLNLVLSRRLVPIYRELSPGAQVRCLYNTVNTPKENRYRPQAREFTMLGRLEERKGTFDLLHVIKQIDGILAPDIKFNLCGDGSLDRVRAMIDELQIAHRIGHLGWVQGDARQAILDRTMAHVLFSYHEGLPMSILETMGCGIVNVATRVAAIPEVITHGTTGFLVEPGDREELARLLVEISEDKALRQRVSEAAFSYISREFSLERGVSSLQQIYDELLS